VRKASAVFLPVFKRGPPLISQEIDMPEFQPGRPCGARDIANVLLEKLT
jgi:hypothetical protein